MALDLDHLTPEVLGFLDEAHLATLTTERLDGTPHMVPVGFTFDAEARLVRVITGSRSQKARHAARGGRAVVCQVDGGRWLALEGTVTLSSAADRVAPAVAAYTARYHPPRDNPDRVALEITVDRIMGRA